MLNLNYIQSVFGVRIRLLVIVLLTMPFAVSGQNVNLNFYVGDTKIKTVSVEAGVTCRLDSCQPDSATMAGYDCHGNHFVGWNVGVPFEGVNWQQPDSLITPVANMSFYAVFSKENAHHFVRVTTENGLEAGAQYLIVSQRIVESEPHYFAMGRSVSTYEHHCEECDTITDPGFDCDDWGNINAERMFPTDDVINDPDENYVWTLNGRPGDWWWTNSTKGLCVVNNRKYWLVEDERTTGCTVEAERGAFTVKSWFVDRKIIKADTILTPYDTILTPRDTVIDEVATVVHDSAFLYDTTFVKADTIYREPPTWYYLKFVQDTISTTDHFFFTGRTPGDKNHPLYLYKREAVYTSYLDHNPWTSHLNAMGGFIGSPDGPRLMDLTEASHGSGFELPAAYRSSTNPLCQGWHFSGWSVGAPVDPTTATPDMHPAGEYYPHYNGENLHAVYDDIRYEKISHASELEDGDIVVFVNTRTHYALKYSAGWASASWWQKDSVYFSEDSTQLLAPLHEPTEMEWTYRGYDKVFYQGDHYLSAYGDNSWHEKIRTGDAPFTFAYSYNNRYFYVTVDTTAYGDNCFRDGYMKDNAKERSAWCYTSNMVMLGSLQDFIYFDIYKKKGQYTSYPHCTAYAVNLKGCGGLVYGERRDSMIYEDVAGGGVLLPSAEIECEGGWTFAGWSVNTDNPSSGGLSSAELKPAGSIYVPKSYGVILYAIYQKGDELTAWPHCDAFSVHFDACGGTCETTDMFETTANQGVRLPRALAKADCANAGWYFAGWSDRPVRTAVEAQTFNLYAPQTAYRPARPSDTLYAVYRQKAYFSYPEYHRDAEPLAWERDGNDRYVVLESFVLPDQPDMHGAIGDPQSQADGTFRILYSGELLAPDARTSVTWGGATSEMQIPYIVSGRMFLSDLLGADGSSESDVYVMPGGTLTVDQDRTVRTLTVRNGATLDIDNGVCLNVRHLILSTDDPSAAPVVNLSPTGGLVLLNDELYLDYRVSGAHDYLFSLPFDAVLAEVTYANEESNGGAPVYGADYAIRSYDGAQRAEDANNGVLQTDYWRNVAAGSTLRAGEGYRLSIADMADIVQPDGRQHTKRVMRFTMRPDRNTWYANEYDKTKTTTVSPSDVSDDINTRHAGWNCVGNPYLSAYMTGDALGSGAMQCGDEPVPYLTVYDADLGRYNQILAAGYRMRPLEAALIQIEQGNLIRFASAEYIVPRPHAPSHSQATLEPLPLYTGITLTGNGETDRTGVVLHEQLTPAYEIGADLAKLTNVGKLNLYTLNADNQPLAFIGMSDNDAKTPIPLGITVPEEGTYTFAFDDEQYQAGELDTLLLRDQLTGTETDLLQDAYAFSVASGTLDNRFTLLVRAKRISTDLTSLPVGKGRGEAVKVLRDGQLYLIYKGMMYTAQGKELR